MQSAVCDARARQTVASSNGHSDAPLKLNLGAGYKPLDGYVNIDRDCGLEAYPLPYDDESVDEVRASHILEHFPHCQVSDVVREWVRVLKPGGWLKIAVPDFDWICRRYLEGVPDNIQGYLMGGQTDANDFHKTMFDRSGLTEVLKHAGLVDVQRWKSEIDDCASYPLSLNLKARKRIPVPRLAIGCAMSTPRLGFQDNFFGWAQALMPLGIEIKRYEGCYWDQCLERTMAEMAEQYDWVLTLDYDSMICRESVENLVRLAYEHPEADAIAAMQMSRGRTTSKPLMVIRDAEGKVQTQMTSDDFEPPLLKVETAHFGMTMVRSSSVKKLPHPWFLGQPNKDGEWGEGRIDPDIYFWYKLRDAGMNAFIANHVVIGHLELMVTWPDRALNPIYQYPSDYHEKGGPENIWE